MLIIKAPTSPYIFLKVRYYSVFMMLAMILGLFISYNFSEKYFETKKEIVLDMFPVLIVSGIVGARLYYVLINLHYFLLNPIESIQIQNGGISIHGALIGGVLGIVIYCKIKKIKVLPYLDNISIGLILAQALGRLGNYFNQEAFGSPTNGFLKLYVDKSYRPQEYVNFDYFHPTFLYEIITNLVVFLILFFILKYKKRRKEGEITLWYLLLYSIFRFFIEMIRVDATLYVMGLSIASVVSLLIIIVCGVFLFKMNRDGAF